MKNLMVLLMMVFLLSACGSEEKLQTYNLTLSGSQAVPINDSVQSAKAVVLLDEKHKKLRAKLYIDDIDGFDAAHIHSGGIGQTGGVLYIFKERDGYQWKAGEKRYLEVIRDGLNYDEIEALKSGVWYINAHTEAVPSGELRAQIVPDTTTILSFKADGSQEVPSVATNASGQGYLAYDSDEETLNLRVNSEGIEDAVAAHIHTGSIGNTGDVLVVLNRDAEDPNVWTAPEDTSLSTEVFDEMLSGGFYTNFHTPEYQSGEIRGQIFSPDYSIYAFSLSGDQEVPAVNTSAIGDGYALLNDVNGNLNLKVVTQGVEDAVAAHIHQGVAGTNGDVVLGLEQSIDNANVWQTPDATVLTDEQKAAFTSGEQYVNVHTPSVPSGEIRGQIVPNTTTILSFKADGSQAVPSVATDAIAQGYLTYNSVEKTLNLRVNSEGIEDAIAAHIHTGSIGNTGGVLVVLNQDAEDPNVWTAPEDTSLSTEMFDEMLSGGFYTNFHTPDYQSGEIRGQIFSSDYSIYTFSLSGDQEVPAVNTIASGDGYALLNDVNGNLNLKVVTQGVEDAVAAHIHEGGVGANGGILFGLEQNADDANVWQTPGETVLTDDQKAAFKSGEQYANVHTPSVVSGEIRGQILSPDFSIYTFPLSGDQEVPSVTTDASGNGYALLNVVNGSLTLKVVTLGVEDAVAAHIHEGVAGTNGGVVLGLVQNTDNANVWQTPDATVLTDEQKAAFTSGEQYVNVHTPSVASGEIRGQIEP